MGRSAIKETCCGFALLCMLSGCGAHNTRTTGTVVEDEAIELKISNSVYQYAKSIPTRTLTQRATTTSCSSRAKRRRKIFGNAFMNLAAATEKVRQVHDYIRVGRTSSLAARSNDTWLTTQVKTQHLRIKDFDPTRVKVVTESGVVYLMGLSKP